MKSIHHHETAVIVVEKNKYHLKITGEGPPLICLHGFSEDHTTWDEFVVPGYTVYRIDMIGHGKSDKPLRRKDYEINAVLQQLHRLIHGLTDKQYSIIGYSMGGRIALAYALRYCYEIDQLILESAGIGIAKERDRIIRYDLDCQLSKQIVEKGIAWFQEHWSGLKIFDTQRTLPQEIKERTKQMRLQNSEHALANVLMEWGQGSLPYFGSQINLLTMPILYISGELDEKYTIIGNEIVKKNVNAVFVKIKDTGHNTHLEQPVQFGQIVKSFLRHYQSTFTVKEVAKHERKEK